MKTAPKKLADAIRDYVSADAATCGTFAGARYKKTIRNYLLRFQQAAGGDRLINEIAPETVKSHLAAYVNRHLALSTIKQAASALLAMLAQQSGGLWPCGFVKDWLSKQARDALSFCAGSGRVRRACRAVGQGEKRLPV